MVGLLDAWSIELLGEGISDAGLSVDVIATQIDGYNAVYRSGDGLFSAVGEAEIF